MSKDLTGIHHKGEYPKTIKIFERCPISLRGFLDSSVGKESTCNAGDPGSIPGLGRSAGEEIGWLPTPVFLGFPCGSGDKEYACNAGDLGSIPGLGRSPGEGKGCPLQYSGLENPMDCIVHRVAKSQTRLSNLHFQQRLKLSHPSLHGFRCFVLAYQV